ncbi:restriction endonuclease subunit S [Epilithonimonas sp.]|uniref:restriction endonuclease subunit S n=1 Tax=Epilithonimonas sp. TaxID=2894511 RepID=UPI00289FE502|nr:restriction endonuclease subunit S [Epilithonimonas sp.]
MISWNIQELGKVSSIHNGSTPSTSVEEFWNGNIVWITPKDLSEQNRKYIEKGERFITKKGLSKVKSKLLPKGTLLLSSRAPIGLLSIAKNELVTNQGFKNIIVDENQISNEFLYYYLKLKVKELNNLGTGTTFKELSKSSLEKFKVKLPDLPTQQKIASVLSALDDKIELNNRINAELEAMAKTLYDYWFVQFDFPNSPPLEGWQNSKNFDGVVGYKSSGGKMVYNETLKREIPEGWEVTVFNDWIKNTKAGDWGKESIEGNYTERVYCIRGADINGINGKGEVKAPERFILKNNSSKKLIPNDFVVEISGGSPVQSTGRIALITESTLERFDTDIICSNFCKAVSIKDENYIYNFKQEWQRLYDAGVFFGFEGKTSGIKNFLFDSFMDSYSIVLPKKEIVEKYYEFAKSIDKKIQSNLKQNQELSALRDWLLPMLMNGQVKVG